MRLVVCPIIYRVFYIPGGAGFLPSTVCTVYRGLCNHVGLLYHCILYHHARDNGDTKQLRSPLFQMPLSIGFATWAFCRLWRRTTSDGANRLLTHRNCLTRPYLIKNIKHKNRENPWQGTSSEKNWTPPCILWISGFNLKMT